MNDTPLSRLLVSGLAALMLGTAPAALAQADARPPAGQPAAEAAQPAVLVADKVFITREKVLVAEGNVEAYQGDTRLQARKVTYDRTSGKLTIEGPIRIDEGGNGTILANAAELDAGLQNGLLTGARMVLDQQLQLAALQMTRVGGRYTQLYKTAVTSCRVCDDGRPPLWQIRARKVTHDQAERQLYFEGAQFRILNTPVFYFPSLRLPGPTLDRASGFLVPSVRTTTQLKTGVKVPYFFKLGDHRDLTLEPYVSPRTNTLGYRYRQAFRNGRITLEGAHTRDDLILGEDRGYLNATGQFDVLRDFMFEFDIRSASDQAYLADYGLPEQDRLRSEVALARITRDSFFRIGAIKYNTLRDGEDETILPTRIADVQFEQRHRPDLIGGELRLGFDTHGHERTSAIDIRGRDVVRSTLDLDWRRSWILATGLRADWQMGVSGDLYRIYQDSNFPNRVTRTTPRAALALRYPMAMVTQAGATHFLEPIAQLGWSNVNGGAVPSDESTFVEFDRGNLLALSRFPAPDAREDGLTFVYGLNWARFAPSGWEASATIGQVFRDVAHPGFTTTSGLAGRQSDLLLAGQLKLLRGLSLTARSLLDSSLEFSKAELRGTWTERRLRLAGSYLWLDADAAENRLTPTNEIWFDGQYDLDPSWTLGASLRYDIQTDQATRAGLGLIWRNECVTVDLSVNRRYTSTTSVEPSTDFGFTISLNGFSVDTGTEQIRRTCS